MSVSRPTGSADSPINSAVDLDGTPVSERVSVACEDRWQVYHRLKELEISCHCGGFQPLQVEIATPTEALQLWSVIRQVSEPRSVLATALDRCWRLSRR